MARVAELGCICCHLRGLGFAPAQVHHLRDGAGGGRRSSDFATMPLCEPCHTGKHGIHGDRKLLKNLGLEEVDLLAATIERLNQ